MSDTVAIKIGLIKTPSSGTQYNPLGDDFQDDIEIDEDSGGTTVELQAGGVDIPISHLTTCNALLVKNLDDTDSAKVTWTDTDANANNQKLPAGRSLLVSDVDPSATCKLTPAAGKTPKCKFYVSGS